MAPPAVRSTRREHASRAAVALLGLACWAASGCGGAPAAAGRGAAAPIDHIVVLFLENRSFDHLFGTFPGADGLAGYRGRQADRSGVAYERLPQPLGRDGRPDPRFPPDLANAPFSMLRFVGPLEETNNPVHRFYHTRSSTCGGSWRRRTGGRAHIEDGSALAAALRHRTLPSVAFVKPHARDNAHPVSSTVGAADRWIADTVREIMASEYWPRVAVVITYDEGGGWFDHVRPPAVDGYGLGSRVPTLVVSPHARRGVVAHGQYDHASILKLIEWRFGLEPLTERDRRAAAFLEAFDFTRPARPPIALP